MHMYLLTQKRPQGDLRATNRQDSTDPAAVVGPSISRTRKITFPAPSTYRSDLLGQSPMRAIAIGGLLRGEAKSVRCRLVCRRRQSAARTTNQSATLHSAAARGRQPSLLSRAGRRAVSQPQRRSFCRQRFTGARHSLRTRRRVVEQLRAPNLRTATCAATALRALHRHS